MPRAACTLAVVAALAATRPARADEAPADGPAVEATATATLRGVVRDPDGSPVEGVVLLAGAEAAVTEADGAYALTVPAGAVVVEISAPWIVDQRVELTLAAGEARALDLVVVDDPAKLAQEVIEVIDAAPVTPGSSRLAAAAARAVPGASGDAGKAVQSLPAVARPPPGSGDVVVWGAAPRDTRVFVDGVPVPALYHLAGWRSAVGNELVDDLALHAAAFGVERGGAIGGVIDVTTRDPAAAPRAVAAADVLDGAAFARGHLGRASIGAGARASWLDRAVRAVADVEVDEVAPLPRWTDAQLVARLPLRPGLEARALVLAAGDQLDRTVPSDDPAAVRRERLRRGFVRAAGSIRRELDDGLAEAVVWAGADADRRALTFGDVPAELDVDAVSAGARAFHRARLRTWLGLSLGVDLAAERARARRAGSLTIPAREGDGAVFGQPPGDDVAADAWSTVTIDAAPLGRVDLVSRRVAVSLGARLDAWLLTASALEPPTDRPGRGWQTVRVVPSPRLSAVARVTDAITATVEAGRYSQARAPADASAVFGTPTLTVEQAWHATVGAAWTLAPVTLEVAAYVRWLDDLVARAPGSTPQLAHALTQDGGGRAQGAQLTVRLAPWRGLAGWLAYGNSRSFRVDRDGAGPRRFDFDQPHGLTAVLGYDRGRWTIGARARWATGLPRTPVTGAFFDARTGRYQPITGRTNSVRLPDFVQLDLRAERRLALGGARAAAYLELQNATGRANAEELAYSADFASSAYITGVPVLAVLGARVEL